MIVYTRAQIREARQTWIDFLQQPERKKARGQLIGIEGGEYRCCLGHACQVLDPDAETGWTWDEGVLPYQLWDRLGMYDNMGENYDEYTSIPGTGKRSLAAVNDTTTMTPQQIGALLATMIEGGADTPFKPLADYPEAL